MKRLLLLALLFFWPGFSQAAGIGIAPESFELLLDPGQTDTVYLSLTNTGAQEALYTVSPDSFSGLIHLDPKSVTLSPGKSVSIAVSVDSFPPGSYLTDISIVAENTKNQEALPKTGVKIPFALHVEDALQAANTALLTPWIAGLLALALLLLFLSYYRSKRKGFFHRTVDAIEETATLGHPDRVIKHYTKHHRIFLLSLLAILLAGILFAVSFWQETRPAESFSSKTNTVYFTEVVFPDKEIKHRVQNPSAPTPLGLLQALEEEGEITLEFDDPTEYGILVTAIDGNHNGDDSKYWIYEVNGKPVPVAANRKQLKAGDTVVWKFILPNENY